MTGITRKNNRGNSGEAKNLLPGNVLIDRRIAELAQNGMVEPFNPECVQPCSYDVHLGRRAKLETPDGFKDLDLSIYSDTCPLMMAPGCFILGETVETIRLPDNVEAHLHLVSSRAREGLQHAVSGLVDAGWQGVLTLELKNNLRYNNIPIYQGLRIAQLTFFEYMESALNPYRGRYFGDTHVSTSKSGKDLLVT